MVEYSDSWTKEIMYRIARDCLGGTFGHEVHKPVNLDALVLIGYMGDRSFKVPLTGREMRLNRDNRRGLVNLFIRRCMHLQNELLGFL